MSQFVFKMPDLGEGTVEAEIVAWHTKPGDSVNEDQVIVEVMTDKAAVEVPAPVSGRVVSITGQPGDKVAVGAALIVFEVAPSVPAGAGTGVSVGAAAVVDRAFGVDGAVGVDGAAVDAAVGLDARVNWAAPAAVALPTPASAPSARLGRVMTSPANRRRAREAGIDLATVAGSGPGGRILSSDLMAAGGHPSALDLGTAATAGAVGPDAVGDVPLAPARPMADSLALPRTAAVARPAPGASAKPGLRAAVNVSAETSSVAPVSPAAERAEITEIKIIGVRRVIAERMSEAKRNIPHFSYIEEVDVSELESLRRHLNAKLPSGESGLTYLPFVVLALVRTLALHPQCNVLHDAARGVLVRHRAVHVGVATQTPDGLKVPVVRDAQALSLWELAAEIRRVSERARSNKATREELSGSTITVTSLGKLGGIASTPVINAPEVAIIGLNKAVERPVVHQGAVAVRRIMNLSSSFDHRFVDGYDAAAMIQTLKDWLEHPATIFIP